MATPRATGRVRTAPQVAGAKRAAFRVAGGSQTC
jgi:hypothetical protein